MTLTLPLQALIIYRLIFGTVYEYLLIAKHKVICQGEKLTLYTRILENKNYNSLYSKNRIISNLRTNGLDLNKEVIDENGYTFLVEVSGDSMINAGINSGDKVLVNSNYPIVTGTIIVGSLNSKPFVKRIIFGENKTILRSENDDYDDIRIMDIDDFTIWGAARRVIKDY